jgi:hypothetical protein
MVRRGREKIARREDVMKTKIKRTAVGALTAAMVLTSFAIEPVRAAPANKAPAAAPAQADMPTDVSSQRRRRAYRRGASPAQALAMFGLIAGTVVAVSQANRHRRHYYGGGVSYAYGAPCGGYYGAPYGHQPYGYGYGPPRYRYW